MSRVGIFGGSFDPVHKGHIAFALQALREAMLDSIYFVPEMKPRRKENVTHVTHRIAMLKLALRPYPKLRVLELPDVHFSVSRTLPRLTHRFPDTELFFLMGTDGELAYLAHWPLVTRLLRSSGLVIADRGNTTKECERVVAGLPEAPKEVHILHTTSADVSSVQIRNAISKNRLPDSVLPSIRGYITTNWLYKVIP